MTNQTLKTLTSHCDRIAEMTKIKNLLSRSVQDPVKVKIETLYVPSFLEIDVARRVSKMYTSVDTLTVLLDTAIAEERKKINKIIDDEVNKKRGTKQNAR